MGKLNRSLTLLFPSVAEMNSLTIKLLADLIWIHRLG